MTKRLLMSLIGTVLCVLAVSAATPQDGKYYRIVNANSSKNGVVITENKSTHALTCNTAGTNTTYTQIWKYTDGKLQNALTQYSISTNSSTSTQFYTTAAGTKMTLETASDGHYLLKCGGYMHADGGNSVVVWNDTQNESNHWEFAEVTVDATKLAAEQADYKATQDALNALKDLASKADTYAAKLDTYFQDKACTKLVSKYASMSDADLRSAMAADGLPEQLQEIAVKVKNSWWTDTNNSSIADKNKYAEEFRIRDYQPYSDASDWRDNRVMTYGLSYMGNPTGIYTTGPTLVSVFVDSDIPSGGTLYLAGVASTTLNTRIQSRTYGTPLKKGLNMVVTDGSDMMYYIIYTVNTVDLTKKIADYPAMRIHIEGGEAIGFYTKPAVNSSEEDAKYVYLKDNAKSGHVFIVKGDHTLFTYDRDAYNYSAAWKKSIFNSIDWYDKVQDWEFSLMGFMDNVAEGKYENTPANANCPINLTGGKAWYPTYCNNPIMSMQGDNGSNPYATYYAISMPGFGGIESSFNADRADFDTWCVGHEAGHQNQLVINLESSTEASNNLFSNLVTYLTGYRMSRGMSFKENEEYNLNHTVFGLRSISITHRMYWNMYLYYHLAGKDKGFYPRFFQMLRDDRLSLGTGTNSWLKFYRLACDAAQEDLTEYFRLWGFFEPCKSTVFGDYTSYTVTLTQAQIDAAIQAVKAKGYPENRQIMFIEDRIKPLDRTDIWASTASNKTKPDNGGNYITLAQRSEYYGDLGMFDDYVNIKAGSYSYTAAGTNITMTGEGGVGFVVYDKDGNIAFLSNELEFTLPAALSVGEYAIKVMNADGTESEATNNTGAAQYREALQNAISDATSYTALTDETGTKMGYYTAEQTAALAALIAEAKEILNNNDEANYVSKYREIMDEILRIQSEETVQKVKESGLYTIQSNRVKTKYLNGTTTMATATTKTAQQQWAFVATKAADTYYMQNVKTLMYAKAKINSSSKLEGWTVDAESTADASTFTLESAGGGSFYIKTNNIEAGNYYLNCDPQGALAVWSADEGSKWNLVRVAEIVTYSDAEMKELVSNTNDLVNTVATITVTNDKLPLQNTDENGQYYVTTNATTGIDEAHSLDYLIDSKSTTYFSTVGASVKAKRFFTINMGEGNEMTDLKLYYRTASGMNTLKPAKITVKTGASAASLTTLTTLTDLPVNTSAAQTYTSALLAPSKPARLWRFIVDENNNSNPGSYPDFALAYITIYSYITTVTPNEGYESIDKTVVKDAKDEADAVTAELKNKPSYLEKYNIYQSLQSAYDKLSAAAAEATGIEGIENNASTTTFGIFDLQGRRLNQVGKSGIYIINGKKVMIK